MEIRRHPASERRRYFTDVIFLVFLFPIALRAKNFVEQQDSTYKGSWRINVQGLYVYKAAAGGTFGLYTAGQTGLALTIGTDILL